MTKCVPGWDPFAYTFTTHEEQTAEEWRAIMKRFNKTVVQVLGVAMQWRVELQRRGTPHLHSVLWFPPPDEWEVDYHLEVWKAWLEATGEFCDLDAQRHATKYRALGGETSGWLVYLALHDGKHKSEQLGWKGRQWGVWNRGKFEDRPPLLELDFRGNRLAMARFLRSFRHLQRRRKVKGSVVLARPSKAFSGYRSFQRMGNGHTLQRLAEWAIETAPVERVSIQKPDTEAAGD